MYRKLPSRDSFTSTVLEDIDKFFNDFMRPYSTGTFYTYGKGQNPKLNAYKKDDQYHLDFFVPMATKDDIDLEINERVLKIAVAARQDKDVADADYIIREVSRGACARELALGEDVDVDSAKVVFKDGVLHITFNAVKPEPKTRKITID
jgi:HSP20 family molecular chaperone IbpA